MTSGARVAQRVRAGTAKEVMLYGATLYGGTSGERRRVGRGSQQGF
jgi:hypothetical protein